MKETIRTHCPSRHKNCMTTTNKKNFLKNLLLKTAVVKIQRNPSDKKVPNRSENLTNCEEDPTTSSSHVKSCLICSEEDNEGSSFPLRPLREQEITSLLDKGMVSTAVNEPRPFICPFCADQLEKIFLLERKISSMTEELKLLLTVIKTVMKMEGCNCKESGTNSSTSQETIDELELTDSEEEDTFQAISVVEVLQNSEEEGEKNSNDGPEGNENDTVCFDQSIVVQDDIGMKEKMLTLQTGDEKENGPSSSTKFRENQCNNKSISLATQITEVTGEEGEIEEVTTLCNTSQADDDIIGQSILVHDDVEVKDEVICPPEEENENALYSPNNSLPEDEGDNINMLLPSTNAPNGKYDQAESFVDSSESEDFLDNPENEESENETEDDNSEFCCQKCSKTFGSSRQLNRHLLIHSIVRDFSCEQCPKKFYSKYHLKRHNLTHKKERKETFCCEHCGKKWESLYQYNRHILTHSKERNFPCEQCPKKYLSQSNLNRHLLNHSEKTQDEEIIPEGITELEMILETHSKRPKRLCRIQAAKIDENEEETNEGINACTSACSSISESESESEEPETPTKRRRKDDESDLLPFECEKCFRKFGTKFYLKQHISLVHDEDATNKTGKVKCDLCKIWVEESELTSQKHHKISKHHFVEEQCKIAEKTRGEGEEIICHLCESFAPSSSEKYPSLDYFRIHIEKSHRSKGLWKCEPCGKDRIVGWHDYNQHLRSESHAIAMALKESEEAGISIETKLPFKCSICPRRFTNEKSLNNHELFHGNETPFICENCGKQCTSKQGLLNHQKLIHNKRTVNTNPKEGLDASSTTFFKCSKCPKKFKSKQLRGSHYRTVHPTPYAKAFAPSFKCDYDECGKVFKNKNGLTQHKKQVHERETKYIHVPCPVPSCKKPIAKTSVYPHLEVKHFPESFENGAKCPFERETRCESEENWVEHVNNCCVGKEITDQSPLCRRCNTLFPSHFTRMLHQLRAHPEASHTCEICSRSFTTRNALQIMHLPTHKEFRPILCSKCGKSFRKKLNLDIHLNSVCNEDEEARLAFVAKRKEKNKEFREKGKPFKCRECGKGFVEERRMEMHFENAHKAIEDRNCDL